MFGCLLASSRASLAPTCTAYILWEQGLPAMLFYSVKVNRLTSAPGSNIEAVARWL